MILTTSTDGCVIIVEVDADREMGRGEYQVSDSMLRVGYLRTFQRILIMMVESTPIKQTYRV